MHLTCNVIAASTNVSLIGFVLHKLFIICLTDIYVRINACSGEDFVLNLFCHKAFIYDASYYLDLQKCYL